jgi:TRAP-type mannitol/chloroaromatic compound transport system permease small subunit
MLRTWILKAINGYLCIVDNINKRLVYVSYLLPLMTLVMTYEVISRFAFNHPTIWAWDTNEQLLAVTAVLTGGYVLLVKGHTTMDMFSSRWSPKTRAVVHSFTFLLGVLFLVGLLNKSFKLALNSVKIKEYSLGLWGPPIYPLRVIIAIGIFLFLVQAVGEILRNITIIMGEEPASTPRDTGKDVE